MNQRDYDIIIVGGGMVGATLACALADGPLRITVVDATPARTDWPGEGFDLRVSAITRASQRIFETIGTWPGMQARRVSPYQDMHVWDATGSGSIHFSAADIGEPDLGHIIENRVILAALTERLQQADNIDYIAPAKPIRLSETESHTLLELEDGRCLQAQLIVGADGARSWVRQQIAVECTGWSYGQKGLVATVRPENSHQHTAWQRFLPSGPLAFLPLSDNHCSIVWSSSDTEAEQLLKLDEAEFLAQLNQALGDSPLGRILETGPRAAFPLRLQHAQSYIGPRVALVGDAAHTIHPLAGQGVNLGLLDAATLADIIQTSQTRGRDFGSHQRLRQYERERKAENLLMMSAMDGFKRLFSNDNNLASLARNLGLRLTDAATPVKHKIVRRAMGLEGHLPPLARPNWNKESPRDNLFRKNSSH